MSSLLEQVETSVSNLERAAVQVRDYYKTHELQIIALLANVESLPVLRASIDTTSMDLSIAGDKEVLKQTWNKLRTMGYETSEVPEEDSTGFSCWWYKEDEPTIWLSFSSTVCKRVKVGTETQEVDVYEVQCE